MFLARVFISCLLLCCFAHVDAAPLFERDALQKDVDVLVQAYGDLHPGLYRYNTPAQLESQIRKLRASLDGPRDLRQTYLAFSEFAATIRCGHTYLNPTNQVASIQRELLEGHNRVPFEFKWLDGRMVITRDLTPNGKLPRGTEVLSINAVTAPQILSRLMTIARADGSNDDKRVALLEVQGTETYETFDIYLPLYFPQINSKQTLVVRSVDGRMRRVEVDALTYAQRLAARHPSAESAQAGWTFDSHDPNFAVLRMPTWALYDSKWDWKGFLDDAFKRVADSKPTALVIDLRENEGGLDVGDAIIPHLLDAPIEVKEPERLVRYRTVPDALAPMLDTWDPSFKELGKDAIPRGSRFYALTEDGKASNVARFVAQPPRYRGKVFVLVGPTNSSATFQFAEMMQRNQLATLVGRPTGGNQRGINGGAFFFLRLPNTKIELDLPLIARFSEQAPDAGIRPDVLVNVTREDIASGRDVELDVVRALLHSPGRADVRSATTGAH